MLLLAASASPPRVLAPRAAAAPPELTVRPARWPDDYDAVCAVRKPTEFVVESGGAGFMGQKVVIDDPEEAQKRRVQARLGSALRDKATVLLAEDSSSGAVVGTLDCVLQQHAAEPSAAPQPRMCAAHYGSRGQPSSPPPPLSHSAAGVWVLCPQAAAEPVGGAEPAAAGAGAEAHGGGRGSRACGGRRRADPHASPSPLAPHCAPL